MSRNLSARCENTAAGGIKDKGNEEIIPQEDGWNVLYE